MVQNKYAVVGSGASGIAVTYYLRQQGFDVELIEAEEAIGGRIRPFLLGDRLVQLGGKNIGIKYRLFREFTAAMGDNPYEFFGLNTSQIRNGQIVTLNGDESQRSLRDFIKNCPKEDFLRIEQMCEAIEKDESNGYLGGFYFDSLASELDDKPVTAYLSEECCKTIIRPMSVRMNGAEPEEIYIGNLGTNLRMFMDSYEILKYGMEVVLDQFSKTGPVRLETKVNSLLVRDGCVVGLRMIDKNGLHEQEYTGVILATPASVSAKLVAPHSPALKALLDLVRYYPVTVIVAEYNHNIFSEEVRSLVFDADKPISNAGAYSFNDRHIIRYTFSGRLARNYIASGIDSEKLLCIGEDELNRHIPVKASERVQFVEKRHSIGLCAYVSHFVKFADSIQTQRANLQNLYLAGDYLQGASVEACFRAGKACAEEVLQSHMKEMDVSLVAK